VGLGRSGRAWKILLQPGFEVPYGTDLAFGGTLDRRCHFKHGSLKQSRFYHCQTSTAHRYSIKLDGSVVTLNNKRFFYRPTRDTPLLSGHGDTLCGKRYLLYFYVDCQRARLGPLTVNTEVQVPFATYIHSTS
jgi:hypothetical protein